MAITKIHPIKVNLKKALDYIENPDKTDDKLFVSSYGCSYETADIEFQMLLDQAFKKGSNLAHHLIQAFEPGETTPEQAHEIGRQLADEVLGGKYPYVITTHIDKGKSYAEWDAQRKGENIPILFTSLLLEKIGELSFSETVQDAEPLKQTVIEAFPESDMAKEYEKLADMIPTLRKSGLTPEQKMRIQMYRLLEPMEKAFIKIEKNCIWQNDISMKVFITKENQFDEVLHCLIDIFSFYLSINFYFLIY